jgi:Domain of unknown function (DUF4397)
MSRTVRIAAAAVGAAVLALITGAPANAAASPPASLSVLHAVPATPVDVYVNHKLTLNDFQPGTLAGPLQLPAGTYSVAITAPNASNDKSPVIGPVDLKLAGGVSYTAAAHLDVNGKPTATLFTNDTSKLPAGQGRLIVRHIAAAPAVDIRAGGKAVVKGLTNPKQAALTVPAGVVSASVTAAGKTAALLGPKDITVAEGADTIVYAWGSASKGTLSLAMQTVRGMAGNPGFIDTGNAGLAAEPDPAVLGWTIAGVLALLAAAGASTVRVVRARR